jgi:putrescine aminotransferase
VIVHDRVADVLVDRGGEFEHGYTYSGHPVACAVAVANVDLLRERRLVERVATDVGPHFDAAWRSLADHPLVGDVDTCGLMGALQLVGDRATGEPLPPEANVGMACRAHAFDEGLVMRAVGDRMIVAPPLVVTRQDVDTIAALARRCLDLTLADLGAAGLA